MDNEEIFTTSFLAGRKRIFVDVKENHAGTYLNVMNLNFDTSEDDLADHCASSGEVASVELLTRGRAQRPSGSAVVEYRYAEAAASAVEALEGTELDGRDLRVRAYFSN